MDPELEKWAFGEIGLKIIDMPESWNKRHGHLFTLQKNDPVYVSQEKIEKAYYERNSDENK